MDSADCDFQYMHGLRVLAFGNSVLDYAKSFRRQAVGRRVGDFHDCIVPEHASAGRGDSVHSVRYFCVYSRIRRKQPCKIGGGIIPLRPKSARKFGAKKRTALKPPSAKTVLFNFGCRHFKFPRRAIFPPAVSGLLRARQARPKFSLRRLSGESNTCASRLLRA